LTGLFGVYLLIRKSAVLRYICRLLAVPFDRLRTGYVSLLANMRVLYHIYRRKSNEIKEIVH